MIASGWAYTCSKAKGSSIIVDRDLGHSAVTFIYMYCSAVNFDLEYRSLVVNNSGVCNRSLLGIVISLLYVSLVFHGRYARGRLW